ncbi:MAG: hypothetical protein ACSLEL_04200 [Candidatus Malihini olakiniferum]
MLREILSLLVLLSWEIQAPFRWKANPQDQSSLHCNNCEWLGKEKSVDFSVERHTQSDSTSPNLPA